MGSRIKTNPKNVFDCFLEIVPASDEKEHPWILQSYPPSYWEKEGDKLKTVPQFVFPCHYTVEAVQHHSFVLTNLEAKWTFGFCRIAPNSDTGLVFLSSLPWHEFFYKLLNQSADLLQNADQGELWKFLEAVHQSRVPMPGLVFHVEYGQGRIFTSPTPNFMYLPSIPENRNLTEYFNAVDPNNMMMIFASMLNERRILITSKRLNRLSACVQAANSVIYPMSWQHIFIPVLPTQLMDYLSAPMPFLIGVPEPIMQRVRRSELGEVVILDADNNAVETPFDDLNSLPSEVVNSLKKSLKPQTLGDGVARAFLQALVHLIGGYRDALKHRQGEKITFSETAFITSRSSSIQPFLEKMLHLQIFQQFIEERLDLLNSGKGFSDEFELECVAFTEKNNKRFKNQYATITQNVRKEGGAFVKAVKSKANPAVKDAVRTVKDSSKMAKQMAKVTYKDVKSRLRENKEEINDDSASVHSAPSSPVQSRSNSVHKYGTISNPQMSRQNTDLNFSKVRKYKRFDPSGSEDPFNESPDAEQRVKVSPDFEDLPRLEYNLMNDLDDFLTRSKAEAGLPSAISIPTHNSVIREPKIPHIPPASAASRDKSPERKTSVGDLITLDTVDDFDPLSTVNQHRKLSRTDTGHASTPQLLPSNPYKPAVNYSQGRYENYAPPGGTSNPQFKQFLSSMTDTPGVRSSDDLLREYGINFGNLSVTSMSPASASPAAPPSLRSTPVMNGNNGFSVDACYSRPTFPSPSLHQNNPMPVRLSQPAASHHHQGLAKAHPNNSFLYANSQLYSSDPLNNSESTVMPVNQRVVGSDIAAIGQTAPSSCRDILAELDPLRNSVSGSPLLNNTGPTRLSALPSQQEVGLPRPPAVPPRTKRWQKFE